MVEKRKMALKSTALTPQEVKALQAFAEKVQKNYPTQIVRMALFGSKARGESTPDSDVDVLLLLKEEDRTLRGHLIDLASEISLEYEVLLSPRVIAEERWQTRKGFSLYQNIARDALALQ